MSKVKIDFLKVWKDKKTGRTYIRFRKSGMKEMSLPGPVGSTQFWDAYRLALDHKIEIGASEGTHGMRRPILERFRERYGDLPLGRLTASFVETYLDKLKPHAARNHLKALRGLLQHAKHDVTAGMKRKAKSKKWTSWPEEWCTRFEERHPIGSKARLCYALARYTGASTSDIARMGPRHVPHDEIVIGRKKTGVEAVVVLHPELQRTLDATPVTGFSTFLITKSGKTYRPTDLSEQFRKWCDEAGLPDGPRGAVIHGLRHRMGDKLAETGSTPSETASVLGHASARSALHYMQGADRKRMARKAMRRLISGTSDEPNVSNHDPVLTLEAKKAAENGHKS
jgi:integrase